MDIYERVYVFFHSRFLNGLMLVLCGIAFLASIMLLLTEAIVVTFHLGEFDLLSTIVFVTAIAIAGPFMRYYYRNMQKRPLTQPYE